MTTDIKRILLAEDDPNDVELTLSVLRKNHLVNDIAVVRDGAQALDYLFRRGEYADRDPAPPAFVLLDLKMPKVDGLEVLRAIKSDESLQSIPVIILTSSQEEQDLVRSYELGVNAYVVKPVDFRDFIDAVGVLGGFWAALKHSKSCGAMTVDSRSHAESATLRVLHVEDDPHDRELAQMTLAGDGLQCEIEYVESRPDFERLLLTHTFDVIIADYKLPAFDGLTAQAIARRLAPEVPFVFLSGTLGEELAIERLKDGAADYVLKQRIGRLSGAVRRAREQAIDRAERRRAEADLLRLNRELEQRVTERTRELAGLNAELENRERRLTESEQRLQAILDHSPASISVPDLDGRYVLVNRRMEEIAGRPRAEIIGRTAHDVWPPRMADQYIANDRRVVTEGRAIEFEEPVLLPDGIHVTGATKFPLFDAAGRVTAVCGFSADITERKKMEDELRLTRLEAHRANVAKSEFLSRMSHDLRTPLNAILGFAQLLEREPLQPDAAESVREITRGGRHLLELINEVLDITRIESGNLAMSPEAVFVREVLERTVNLIRPLAVQNGLTLEMSALPPGDLVVRADRQRLRQILINLLANAVKYNRPNGSITVSVIRIASEHPERLRILVADTGPGIPPEKIKLLFQPFERLGAERSSVEGTGLGLSVSRSLAHAMGARVGGVDRQSRLDVLDRAGEHQGIAGAPAGRRTGSARRRRAGRAAGPRPVHRGQPRQRQAHDAHPRAAARRDAPSRRRRSVGVRRDRGASAGSDPARSASARRAGRRNPAAPLRQSSHSRRAQGHRDGGRNRRPRAPVEGRGRGGLRDEAARRREHSAPARRVAREDAWSPHRWLIRSRTNRN